jgi:hypothetical protein
MYQHTSVQNLPFKSYEGRPKPADAPKTHKQGKIHRHRHVAVFSAQLTLIASHNAQLNAQLALN